jgi:hypothetical protein
MPSPGAVPGLRLADHGPHPRAVRQLQRRTVVAVAVPQVKVTGPFVGGFQVGGYPGLVEPGVVIVQQRGADTRSLPVRADGEDCQVVVRKPGWVVPVELGVQDLEPVQSLPGDRAAGHAVRDQPPARVQAEE